MSMLSMNCKGKLLSLEKPLVMGIINATPDSFYEGDLYETKQHILSKVAKMVTDGAAIIDIGGQSTKPESSRISANEECDRVLPVIELVKNNFPDIIISIDTFYSSVAGEAIQIGASMVNDISAGDMDSDMIKLVSKEKVPFICMHMQGTPQNMQKNPSYQHVTKEVIEYFIKKISICKQAGILDILIDPGFGFGKSISHNYQLLKELNMFTMLNCPILVGLSRKSMISKILQTEANQALNGTTVLHTLALQQGANILRVHDVKEAYETIQLMEVYKNAAQC